jgi:hypothetical protein
MSAPPIGIVMVTPKVTTRGRPPASAISASFPDQVVVALDVLLDSEMRREGPNLFLAVPDCAVCGPSRTAGAVAAALLEPDHRDHAEVVRPADR